MQPDKRLIEPRFKISIDAWVAYARPTGGFVEALLLNDLKETMQRGDPEALANLPHIVAYLVNEVPASAWGSPDALAKWERRYRERHEGLPIKPRVAPETPAPASKSEGSKCGVCLFERIEVVALIDRVCPRCGTDYRASIR